MKHKNKYKVGYKVQYNGDIFTVSSFRWNGITFMYSFEETEMSCGQMYLTPYVDKQQQYLNEVKNTKLS